MIGMDNSKLTIYCLFFDDMTYFITSKYLLGITLMVALIVFRESHLTIHDDKR